MLDFEAAYRPPWRRRCTEETVARELPGPPADQGAFGRLRRAVADYAFSDPRIVKARYDRGAPLLGQEMRLEIRALGVCIPCRTRVTEVLERADAKSTSYGFRYDTLPGHIERGAEWFVLRKDHRTGEIRFRIHALWRAGDFPNLFIRAGFFLVAWRYQRLWHRRAYHRLRRIANEERNPFESEEGHPRRGADRRQEHLGRPRDREKRGLPVRALDRRGGVRGDRG